MTAAGPAPGDPLRWEPIRYFVAVARAGSVMAAARQLGVGHATVLRNVARLEAGLGLRLFDHVRTGYRLTADGEEFGHTPATFRLHPARVAVRVAQDDAGAAHVDG